MLYILLLILKIIGIIVISIIGIILLLLCLVLFVPIRYRIKSDNEEALQVIGSVTWLLHFIKIHLIYKEDFTYFISVFGIQVYPKKNKKIYSKKIKKVPKSIKSKKLDESQIKTVVDTKSKDKTVIKKDTNININTDTKKDNNNKISFFKKIIHKIKFTFKEVYDKIKKNISIFIKNIQIIKDESTKRAFHLCKKELLHILKLILPRKIKGVLKLGLKDPSLTGELYGLYSVFYPVHKGNILMIPFFEEEIFFYRILIVGHIRIITLLIIALKIYFNKDIKRLIHIFKKEES